MTDEHKKIVAKNIKAYNKKKSKKKKGNYTTSDQRPFKIAQAKLLAEQDLSLSKISKFLNISKITAKKYVNMGSSETIDKLKAIAEVKYFETDWKLTNSAYKGINEHLSDSNKMDKTRLHELTGLYRTARELQKDHTSVNAQQTNIYINDSGKGFSISTDKPDTKE